MMRVHVDRLCMKEKEARSIIAELKTGDFGAVKRVRNFQEEQSRLGMMRVHVDRLCMKEKEARSIIAELKTGDFGAVKRVRIMGT